MTPTVARCDMARPTPQVLALTGALTFATAAATWRAASVALAAQPATELELAGLQQVDSAGLACVLALLARQHGALRVVHAPDSLRALARVSDAERWLDTAA